VLDDVIADTIRPVEAKAPGVTTKGFVFGKVRSRCVFGVFARTPFSENERGFKRVSLNQIPCKTDAIDF